MTSPITATSTANTLYPYTAASTTTGTSSTSTSSTPPTGIVGTDGTTNTNGTQTNAQTDNIEDDKDLFLKLLIAQMQNQDPDSPTDSSQYLSQMASFSEVEKLETIADSQASLLTSNQMSTAVGMIGDTVSYGAGDSASSGKVTGVTVIDGVPQLLVGTTKVALSDVTGVAAPDGTAIAPDAGTTSSGSTSSSTSGSSDSSAAEAAAFTNALSSAALSDPNLNTGGSDASSDDSDSSDLTSLDSLYGITT